MPTIVAAAICEVPSVVNERVGDFGARFRSGSDSYLALFNLASLLTANSEIALSSLRDIFPDKPSMLSPNIVDLASLDTGSHQRADALVVSRLVERKGIDAIIEAFRPENNRDLSLNVHIFGEGPARAGLERKVAALGLQKIVLFHGFVPARQINYSAYRFFLANGLNEGSSNALLEAVLAGCVPIFRSDMNGVEYLLKMTQAHLLVTDGSAGEFRERLSCFVSKPDMEEKIRSILRITIENHALESDLQTGEFLRALRTISGKSPATPATGPGPR